MIRKSRDVHRHSSDPTPAEIRRRTESIRKAWSDTELSRRSGLKPIAWMPPILLSAELPEMSGGESGILT